MCPPADPSPSTAPVVQEVLKTLMFRDSMVKLVWKSEIEAIGTQSEEGGLLGNLMQGMKLELDDKIDVNFGDGEYSCASSFFIVQHFTFFLSNSGSLPQELVDSQLYSTFCIF